MNGGLSTFHMLGKFLRVTEQGFEFASYEDNSKLYHFRKEIVSERVIQAASQVVLRGSIASSLGGDRK